MTKFFKRFFRWESSKNLMSAEEFMRVEFKRDFASMQKNNQLHSQQLVRNLLARGQ